LATRYDKAADGYTGLILAASTRPWIRRFFNGT